MDDNTNLTTTTCDCGERVNVIEENQEISSLTKSLTDEEKKLLNVQNSRIISDYKAKQLELNAKKYWDLFYKRNDTRFFKNRHWTTREFQELLPIVENCSDGGNSNPMNNNRKTLLEIGCGVGNLIFPLIEDKLNSDYFIYACDFSSTAIDLVKTNPLYNETYVKAFQTDITTDNIYQHIAKESLDIITMVFVLSAIHPDKFKCVLYNIYTLLKPGGILLFRDYGLYDMAQLRFKPGNKISDNLYMRQDGTRSYYFSTDELSNLVQNEGFEILSNTYINRRTINIKENVDSPRIFLQGKYIKKK